MDPLSWTGQIAFLTPLLTLVFGLLGLSVLSWIVLNAVLPENRAINSVGGSQSLSAGPRDIASLAV
jgi:peptide/nickel transport system permease protein